MSDSRVINEYQRNKYNLSREIMKHLMDKYTDILDLMKDKESVNILDLGGGNGEFAYLLAEYLPQKVNIYVVDNTPYHGWEYNENIQFIEASAFSIDKLFEKEYFDLIFALRFLHHVVFDTWKKTQAGLNEIMSKIHAVLKNDGYLCITEEPAESYLYDGIGSFMIYKLTSNKNRIVSAICEKLDAKSAGVGTCFLSDGLWKKMFINNHFKINKTIPGVKRKLKWYMKVFLLLKDYHFSVGYVLQKSPPPPSYS